MGKQWWKSKTLWFNALAMAAAFLAPGGVLGHVLNPEETAAVLGVGNMVLRAMTTEPITKGN